MSWRQNAIQMSLPEVLSNYLQEQYLIRRPVLAKAMQLRAFGVTHALTLGEASAHKLELAGLGAVEKSLDSYLREAREAAEAALRDAQPDEIAPRLFSLGGVMIPPPVPEEQEVWKHALAELLSPDQRALWEKEVAERTRYDESAVVGLILLDVGEKYGISEAQETSLGPLILNAMHEMERRRPPRRHWYFSAAERLLPFLSIGEPELKEILTPDQWRDFEGHDAFNLRQRLDAQKRALDLLGKP